MTEEQITYVNEALYYIGLKNVQDIILIQKQATNGDVIKALFPKIDDNFSNVIDLKLWWNAPYEKEEQK